MTKVCGILAGLAAVILACAAIWLGGLNQDEGWYLYAAQLVHAGKMPYRDFFYTQGPLMPIVYSALTWAWSSAGLLGARLLTAVIGLSAALILVATVRLLVPVGRRNAASIVLALLLVCNLYHVYYVAIPKTYALASLFVAIGFHLLVRTFCVAAVRCRGALLAAAGLSLALAAGTRISLGLLLVTCGFGLLIAHRTFRWDFLWFGLGGAFGLLLVYGPFCLDQGAFAGLCTAQRYHAARGGFSPVFVVGSLSRLMRWYLPVFILLGLAVRSRAADAEPPAAARQAMGVRLSLGLALAGFAGVFAVQMLAPFPYEDYQVPIMGLLALSAVALTVGRVESDRLPRLVLLTTGLAYATAFASPLLEGWMTNGQDRFWSLRKEATELAQLQEAARQIERFDPGGKTLLTQDLYLAIETGRTVPEQLAMGPFSMLTDKEWRALLESAPLDYPLAALSGYTFAIEPPACSERAPAQQEAYWEIVRRGYEGVASMQAFGQNATELKIMRKRGLP